MKAPQVVAALSHAPFSNYAPTARTAPSREDWLFKQLTYSTIIYFRKKVEKIWLVNSLQYMY